MSPRAPLAGLALLLFAAALALPGRAQTPARPAPRLEPIAETRLLMEGLANANFRGLDRLFAKKPDDAQTWTFARGQALLIAETANLLMLRPPKNAQAQAVWFDRAMDLRQQARKLAVAASRRDYTGSRAGLVDVANSCNRCHQAFRIAVEVTPFQQPPPPAPKVE